MLGGVDAACAALTATLIRAPELAAANGNAEAPAAAQLAEAPAAEAPAPAQPHLRRNYDLR